MRKLQHQYSCHATVEETSHTEDQPLQKLIQTDLSPNSKQNQIRNLEGKILLLEQKGKNIQQFYENKIAQLKTVLFKQGETKSELVEELQKLISDGQKQNRYVSQLKNQLQAERINTITQLGKEIQPTRKYEPSFQKYSIRKNSRGKGCMLFNSNNIGLASKSKLAIKKCRSEQYLESEYFIGDTHGKSQKLIPNIQNPQKDRFKPPNRNFQSMALRKK